MKQAGVELEMIRELTPSQTRVRKGRVIAGEHSPVDLLEN